MIHPIRFECLALVAAFALSGLRASQADTAQYELTFDATWSASTHPLDFPSSAHFSGLIGGTHNASVSFWENGQLASLGIERMAESGSKSPMTEEVQAAIDAGGAWGLISGGGIGRSPGVVMEDFEISSTHPLTTVVSMIAPSPDWFVGVHDLNLRPNGSWLAEVTVDLWPYDAGTDSGPDFTSRNEDTMPREAIRRMTESPFEGTPALGTFTFRLASLLGDFNESGVHDADDVDLLCGSLGTLDMRFDLTDDGQVDVSDVTRLIEGIVETKFGDVDLNGNVAFEDFAALANSYGGAGGWGDGDFNCDAQVTFPDFVTLANNFGFSRDEPAVSTVPEPSAGLLWICLASLAVHAFRRQ